jgi:peptide/nickel transport system substrate-binding protein
LNVIPLWERYGNNPALDGERVTGWLPDSDPIYQNSPYEDSFTVIMLMDGTLKPAGQ